MRGRDAKSAGVGWRSDLLPSPAGPDPDRRAVRAALDGLVAAGCAEWRSLAGGATEIRLATGQRFRLEDDGITRSH